MTIKQKWQAPPVPYPPEVKATDIRAIQHLMAYAVGQDETVPSPEVCKRAMDWIINEASKRYDVAFFSNDPHGRSDAFMCGRQYVGKQITLMMQLKPDKFDG